MPPYCSPYIYKGITRFNKNTLAETVVHMRQLIDNIPFQFSCQEPPKDETIVPRLVIGTHGLDDFVSYLRSGTPVIIPNATQYLQGYWTPQDFIDKHGQERVTLIHCETGRQKSSTVGAYFQSLLDFEASDSSEIWKLKDWPPTETFKEGFPDLFEAFRRAVPFPDICAVDGIFNLAAHFAVNGTMPDLGPKMYMANGTKIDDHHHGSTRLHLDMTDAVNILTWAAPQPDGTSGGAKWTIWPAAYRSQLRDFLATDQLIQHDLMKDGDPIHCQKYYLGPSLLARFHQRYGIRPYTIFQRVGEAIIIPAGCAHQVSNCTNAIKVACDFISVCNLPITESLADEFRQHRLQVGEGTDVLQLFTTISYAWESLHSLYRQQTQGTEEKPANLAQELQRQLKRQNKNKKGREKRKSVIKAGEYHRCASNRESDTLRYQCPLHGKWYNRSGFLDHFLALHSDRLKITPEELSQLRKTSKYSFAAFWSFFWTHTDIIDAECKVPFTIGNTY
ncbi:hypothetical protein NM688_g6705 [Phlebia brevispora]|uniref:Uncharacterized protein n=1 Tax=Phlebia brevispora TaxID=194682 RepID=A0ACC1SDB0_9APHY|nr:hypothetical protein NM688_g6705 [Phlebia brevispora]